MARRKQPVIPDQLLDQLLAGTDAKTGRPIEVPLPSALTPAISAYLDKHRPVLLRGVACDAFWVSKARRAMGDMAIYMRIVKLTREAFGAAVNPHLFRRGDHYRHRRSGPRPRQRRRARAQVAEGHRETL